MSSKCLAQGEAKIFQRGTPGWRILEEVGVERGHGGEDADHARVLPLHIVHDVRLGREVRDIVLALSHRKKAFSRPPKTMLTDACRIEVCGSCIHII